jgi:ankyrin repeat protein
MASDRGHLAVVELLLAKGASVNQGAVAIHDYLINEVIAFSPTTTPFHLWKQASKKA